MSGSSGDNNRGSGGGSSGENNRGGGGGGGGDNRRRRRPRRRPGQQGESNRDGQRGETDRDGRRGETDRDGEYERSENTYDLGFWNYIPPAPTEEEIFWTIPQGENFRGYNDLPKEVKGPGSEKYQPAESFEDGGLSNTVLKNLVKSKYNQPTPVQKNAIPIISDDRDLMACAQTGSGKTGAYLLPIISNLSKMSELPPYNEVPSPLVLILVPTTELARQVHIDAKRFSFKTNIRVVAIYGGVDKDHQVKELQSECGCHFIVASPGRLITLLDDKEISLGNVKYLVLDEADRMLVSDKKVDEEKLVVSESGFYHDIQKLVTGYDMPVKEDRQTLMFSATFPKKIQELAMKLLNNHLHLWIGKEEEGGTFCDITQTVIQVDANAKRDKLVEILTAEEGKRNLVFVTTKNQAKRLVKHLKQNGFSVADIHSDRVQGERETSLRKFRGMKGDGTTAVPVVIATAAASRGLDIEDIEQVINYDLPDTDHVGIEEYIHKVGRTGRIGNKGRAISFYDPQKDQAIARALVKALADSLQDVPDWLDEAAELALGTKIEASEKFVSSDIRTDDTN